MLSDVLGAGPHVRAGRVRGVAVSAMKRTSAFPDIPTVNESGVPGYDVTGWNALFVKAGTPSDIVARLNKEIAAVTAMPDIKEKYIGLGIVAGSTTPEVIGKRLVDDIA